LDNIADSARLTLIDLVVGQVFKSASYQLNAAEIIEFAEEYDPQPFHTDHELAKQTFFGGLAASGWQTASVTMKLLVASTPILGGLIGASAEISWPRPTRPGDTLRVETEVLEIRPSKSRPDRGTIIVRSITLNQNDEPVQTLVSKLVVPSGR
jgi:acyl dehydratase